MDIDHVDATSAHKGFRAARSQGTVWGGVLVPLLVLAQQAALGAQAG